MPEYQSQDNVEPIVLGNGTETGSGAISLKSLYDNSTVPRLLRLLATEQCPHRRSQQKSKGLAAYLPIVHLVSAEVKVSEDTGSY